MLFQLLLYEITLLCFRLPQVALLLIQQTSYVYNFWLARPLFNSLYHPCYSKNGNNPLYVISKSTETELSLHFLQSPHQEIPLFVPMLDSSKWVFNNLLSLLHSLRVRINAPLHPFHYIFIYPASNTSPVLVASALRFQVASSAGWCCVVTDMATLLMRIKTVC